MILPSPLAHSSTNAAEHRCGYSWRMYDPSKTATSNLSRMASATHSVPPSINMCSQSHMHPHSRRTSRKVVWGVATGALGAVDVTRNTPGCISSTEHTSPLSCRGCVAVFVYLFDFLTVLEYTSVVSDPQAVCRSVLSVGFLAPLPWVYLVRLTHVLTHAVDSETAWANVLHGLLPQREIRVGWLLLWPSHGRVGLACCLTLKYCWVDPQSRCRQYI
jgi:hypothetical protein